MGLRKCYSIFDHLQTVTQVIETDECRVPLAATQGTKAFGSVESKEAMAALEEQGLDHINVLCHIYDNVASLIGLNKDSLPFQLKKSNKISNKIIHTLPNCLLAAYGKLFNNRTGRKRDNTVIITSKKLELQLIIQRYKGNSGPPHKLKKD